MAKQNYKTVEQIISDAKAARLGILNLSTADSLHSHVRAALRVLASYLPDDDVVVKASRSATKVKTTPCAIKNMRDLTALTTIKEEAPVANPAKKKDSAPSDLEAKVVEFANAHPNATRIEIGKATGVDRRRVGEILRKHSSKTERKAAKKDTPAPKATKKVAKKEQDISIAAIETFLKSDPHANMRTIGAHFGVDRRRVGEVLKGKLPALRAKYAPKKQATPKQANARSSSSITPTIRSKLIKFASTAKGKKMTKKELASKFGIDRRRVGEILKNG